MVGGEIMTLNFRCIDMMKMLSISSKSLEELCEYFGVSSRSIRYDFDNINFILSNLKMKEIEKNREKKFVLNIDKNRLEKIVIDFAEITPEERRDYLLFKLLLENNLCITKEIELLDITRGVLRNDLDKIREMTSLNIKFTQGKGASLLESEEKIREVLSGKIILFMDRINMLKEPLRTLFMESTKKYNFTVLKENIERIKNIDSSFVDSKFHKILSLLLCASIRESYIEKESAISLGEVMGLKNMKHDILLTDFERKELYFTLEKSDEKEEEKISEFLLKLKQDFNLKIDFPSELHGVLENIYDSNKNLNFLKVSNALNDVLDEGYLLTTIYNKVKSYFPELYRDYSLMMAMKIREHIISLGWDKLKNRKIVLVSSLDKLKANKISSTIKRVLNIEVSEIITPFMYHFSHEENSSSLIFTTEKLKKDIFEKKGDIFHLDTEIIENYFTLKKEDLQKIISEGIISL